MMKGTVYNMAIDDGDDNEASNLTLFDMGALRMNLPDQKSRRRGGLSRYYSGKSESFTCVAENDHQIRCVKDLKKKRKKQDEDDDEDDDDNGDDQYHTINKKRNHDKYYSYGQPLSMLLPPPGIQC